ncbi:type II secretion system F family protein [Arthrobacter sp. L77]|uniref:type II secretion system F family protein n=1 Tax=Arthrobacter sp. L77 TaxID=1496689 RepID=UPI0005B93E10|nr:type II secretion system F family protein [Arthrobacter sp. L77]
MTLLFGLLLCYAATVTVVFVLLPARPRTLLSKGASSRPEDGPGSIALRFTARLEKVLRQRNYSGALSRAIEQAGLTMSAAEFVVFAGVGTILLAGLASSAGGLLLALAALLAGPFIARLVLRFLASRRRTAFADQLDETLQLLAGGLRAGHSLLRAIDAAAEESEAPTSEEFARIINETRLGRDIGEALDDAAIRMRSLDFSWVAQAIAIHREVGGNLADVLDQVGHTIRERNQIRGQVRSLSAEGRISALVLMVLPFALGGILVVISPGYMDPLVQHPVGLAMIAVSVVLLVIGGVWLRKVVSFRF